jgi:acetyltransferase (GNAT) family protein
MEYRWLTNDEIEDLVNEVCQRHGWAQLNINEAQPTCRVLGAFEDVALVGFIALQMQPVIGPGWTDAEHRDGKTMRELADQMHQFLVEVKARGALTVCESPVSERLAQRHGMKQVEFPVYEWIGR